MDLNEDNLKTVKYKMSSFILTIGDTKYEVETTHISRIIFDRDYDNFYFPYFQIDIVVTAATYRKMKKDSGNIVCNMVFKNAFYTNANNLEENTPLFTNTELTGKYKVYLDNSSPDLTEANQEAAEKSDTSTTAMIPVKLLLYNYNTFTKYNVVINNILSEVTLVDIVGYLFTVMKLKNVIMSPASSKKEYSQFVVTPLKFFEQLNRVCNGYGIHKDGTTIFFDTMYNYVIEKNAKCSGYRTGEIRNTYLISPSDESNDSSAVSGSYKSNKYKANVVALNSNSLDMKNMSDLISTTHGNNYAVINTSTGEVSTTLIDETTDVINNVMVKNEGEDTSNALKNELSENKNPITIGCAGVGLDMFNPNKQFILSLSGKRFKKYNGKYRISRATASFLKEGDLFNISMSISLKG